MNVPRDHFNIQTLSYQNGNFHYKSKMVSDLYNGNLCVWQDGLMHTNIHGHGFMVKCCQFAIILSTKFILKSLKAEAALRKLSLIARFLGPSWGPFGTNRTQVGPMLAPWTLLSGMFYFVINSMSADDQALSIHMQEHWWQTADSICKVLTGMPVNTMMNKINT